MAKSKTYSKTCSAVGSFSYAGNFKLYVELNETSVSTSDNTSKVKYNVYCQKPSDTGGSIDAKHLKYFKINGKEIINSTSTVDVSGYPAKISIASGTTDAIKHGSDGSKSISVSAKIEASSYGVKASISETFALTDIARYFTDTPILQKNSKTSTTYTWNWTTSETCSKVVVYVDGVAKATWTGSAKSGTIKATGLSPATEYDVYLKCTRSDSGLTSNSATKQYQTAPKTIPTISLSSKTTSSITVTSGCNVSVDSTQYRIKKSGGSYGSWQTGATFSGLSANTAYVVQVYKTNSETGEGGYAELSVTTYAKTIPTIALSSKTSSSITVSSGCNVSVSSTNYRIKKSGGTYGSYQTSATFNGLAANTTYVVQVQKVGSATGESGYAEISITTHPKTIPTISLSSKTVNSITVTSGCNIEVSSTQYRIKKSDGSYGSYQTGATFSGLSPNTAYVVEVKKVGKVNGEAATATISVTTYDIARLTSYPNFNLGDSVTVNYSNPSGAAIQVGLYKDGQTALAAYRNCSGSSYTFNFTDAELDEIYKKMSENSLDAYFYINTNNNAYRESKPIKITLTGNQKTARINVNGNWKRAKRWININGTWKRCVRWININGTWKRCI